MDDYTIKERVSKGTNEKEYALKQVPLEHSSRVERQEALDEARILAKLDHPYIIKHYLSFIEDNTLHIVMELAKSGTLYHLRNGPRLDEDRIWKYCIQMLLAMQYIHSKKIIHRDIKTLNLMLDGNDDVKLGDFGIARAQSTGTNMLRTLVGTPFYLSPELCDDKPYNSAADMWAIGVCLYELCMGKHPFSAQNEGALIRKIMRGDYERPTGYSRDLLSVVMACLAYDHKSRASAATLLARPVVNKKAHDLHILPLAPARRPSVQQDAIQTPAGPGQTAAPRVAERNALVEMPAANRVREKHLFAREGSAEKVEYARAPSSVDKPVVEKPMEAEQMHPNIQDNVHHLMQMSLLNCGTRQKTGRLAPAELPPAGAKCNRTHDSAPYAKHAACPNQDTGCDTSLWTHQYERPQYARKRSQDLMVTGPNPRTAGPTPGRQVKAAGYYAYEASVNTSTSYMNGGSHS